MIKLAVMDPDFLHDYTELYINVFRNEPWNESWTDDVGYQRLLDLIHTPNFLGYALWDHNQLIGFIAGYSKMNFMGKTFYLAEFCVTTQIQGKGYGSWLLHHLEQKLTEKGITSLFLITEKIGTISDFYRKKGYSMNESRMVMRKELK
ncbi:GNAT family N-acetyltransferase [Sporolactobacillus shoreicorticis]|uniref:GNAT family N-acetyltransferase n=1 Tax=Sporolactobacillus shoreicorticis TaxID=1923877 RepID=A0ABW5S2R7_9BACL|nr:GNAT family N-acetyltransferase [Sporolactobacillus shoreicorticis]MCO7126448.1 GNAT family N-acetyltransferase [Sporolactobacillus shoreicorticis]